MNNLTDLLEYIKAKDFKIIGNKVLIKSLNLRDTVESALKNIKYDFYVGELITEYVPKFIKSCDVLKLYAGYEFDGYFPKIKEHLGVYPMENYYKTLYLPNIVCDQVCLGESNYSGFIKSSSVILGVPSSRPNVMDLTVEGYGNNSLLFTIVNSYNGLHVSNFDTVKMSETTAKYNGVIEINDCGTIDIKDYSNIYDFPNFKLHNVKELIVWGPFKPDCVVEADRVIFSELTLLQSRVSNSYKGVYLCDEFVVGGETYSKSNPYVEDLPNIKFR